MLIGERDPTLLLSDGADAVLLNKENLPRVSSLSSHTSLIIRVVDADLTFGRGIEGVLIVLGNFKKPPVDFGTIVLVGGKT
jgi:hypothetical protein